MKAYIAAESKIKVSLTESQVQTYRSVILYGRIQIILRRDLG